MDRFIEVILFGQGDGRLRYIPSEELAAQVCFARTNLDAKKGDCCEMLQDVSRCFKKPKGSWGFNVHA
jgi:hypothetical protein